MFDILTSVFAQGKSPSGDSPGSSFMSFIPIILMIVIFYFILIRPSQKKEKDRKKMIEAIQKGDKVLTAGGIYGVVISVKPEENIVVLKISDGTKVEFAKSSIQSKVS